MCWCTPNIRTPNCGRIGCHPPKPKIDWEKVFSEFDNRRVYALLPSQKEHIQILVEKQLAGEG